jgi:restriction endonuclease S subunit
VSASARQGPRWKFKLLGEVFEVIGGGTPSKQEASYYGGNIPWATIRDMHSSHLSSTEHSITRLGLENSSSKLIPAGEVIMASRVGLGKSSILTQDTAINQDIRALIPRKSASVDRKFLLYWLQSVADEIVAAGTGATVQGVTLPFIKGLPFPDTSVDEQKRIVAVLDQAFAALDCARANAELNAEDLSRLRNSIISASLEAGLDASSKVIRLGELCVISRGGSPRPISKFLTDDPDGINWIKISDATASGKFIESTKEKIIRDGVSRSRYVASGSFLLTNSMSFGRPYILRTSGCIHDGWLVMEPDYEQVDQEFLYYLLGSQQVYGEFDRLAAGSTVRNLNIDLVSKVSVRLPSLEKQREAVGSIIRAVDGIDDMAKAYEAKLADIATLRQSLLQAAFSGQLT